MTRRNLQRIEIAAIGRTHGVFGELNVFPLNSETSLLSPGRKLQVADRKKSDPIQVNPRPTFDNELIVERAWETPRGWIVKFEGVDSKEVAAALTNHKLFIERADLPALKPGEVYQNDLIGFCVEDRQGRELGRIVGFFDNGAHEVCVIQVGNVEQGSSDSPIEVLLPFRPDNIVDVEIQGEKVVLDVPEGIPGLDQVPDKTRLTDGS